MVPCGFLDEAGSMIEMLGWNCFRGWWKSNTPRETMVSHWIHLFWVNPGWIVLQYTSIFCYKWAHARRNYENAGDTWGYVIPLPGWFGIAPQVVNSWGWFIMDPTWCTVPSVLNLVLSLDLTSKSWPHLFHFHKLKYHKAVRTSCLSGIISWI